MQFLCSFSAGLPPDTEGFALANLTPALHCVPWNYMCDVPHRSCQFLPGRCPFPPLQSVPLRRANGSLLLPPVGLLPRRVLACPCATRSHGIPTMVTPFACHSPLRRLRPWPRLCSHSLVHSPSLLDTCGCYRQYLFHLGCAYAMDPAAWPPVSLLPQRVWVRRSRWLGRSVQSLVAYIHFGRPRLVRWL